MDAHETAASRLCQKLHEVPPVYTEWQQPVLCPDCEYYDRGQCSSPALGDDSGTCPFDGQPLPLKEVTTDPSGRHPPTPLDAASCGSAASDSPFAELEQAIRSQVIERTGRRIQGLTIERTESELVIRGTAPCFYVKQLALHAALDLLRSSCEIAVALRVDVEVLPRSPGPVGPRVTADMHEEWP